MENRWYCFENLELEIDISNITSEIEDENKTNHCRIPASNLSTYPVAERAKVRKTRSNLKRNNRFAPWRSMTEF